jgi:hypothetical protein
MYYSSSTAIIKQLLEVFLKEIKARKRLGKGKNCVRNKGMKVIISSWDLSFLFK